MIFTAFWIHSYVNAWTLKMLEHIFPLGINSDASVILLINETTSDPYNLHHTPHPSMTPQPCLVITVMVYSFLVGAPQQQHRPARALYVPLPGWHPRWWPEYHACIETSPKTVTAVHVRLFIMRCGGCVAQVWKWHQSDVHGWHHSDSVSMNVCTCVCILYV